eukprot:TRINITY_DN12444_c0_g2_i1.p1 TRINITY_DN12444_c0_g2~~TRINITY_DN12444_c0_g2_i1.p1  ORF type:complete len:256 (+),score=62.75 TRINITY_DN12444_c0_g2_i1:70-837(+)
MAAIRRLRCDLAPAVRRAFHRGVGSAALDAGGALGLARLCRVAPHAAHQWIPVRRYSAGDKFDVFQKLKDPPEEGEGKAKRKPSDKVLRLVDEIMSLTLIEAADLCDLCQEKLAPGDGSPIPGRMPFPHPMGMFPGGMMPGMMPQGAPMPAAPVAQAAPAAAPAAGPAAEEPAPAEEKKKEEKKKEFVTIKLLGFDTPKKINVVKEVRSVTSLGLKEAKELVEGAPKLLKKGVPAAEAEAIRDKLIAAGAQVALE